MKILLFDIDGTLITAGKSASRAFNNAFRTLFGVDRASEGINKYGATDPMIIHRTAQISLNRSLSEHEYKNLCKKYISELSKELEDEPDYQIMPGVEELCEVLSSNPNVALGLETGNLKASGMLKLKRGRIDHYFEFGGFGSDSPDRAEIVRVGIEEAQKQYNLDQVSKKDIFVIGDAPQDIQAGQRQGVNTIGVATGLKGTELISENPTHLLDDLSNTRKFLELINIK